jgi:hypothetical protein
MSQKKLKQHIVSTFFSALLVVSAVFPINAGADSHAQVNGATIGDWSAKWWQWALQIPAGSNPLLDQTGANCGQGQKGPVWFLAGTFYPINYPVTRNCNIPRGKSIFFPIANYVWVQTYLDDPNNTETDYRQCVSGLPPRPDMFCDNGITPVAGGLEATLEEDKLNGKTEPIIFNFASPIVRAQSPVFKVKHWPEPNVFYNLPAVANNGSNGYNDGDIVSDGFWVMLPPLKPGKYVLKFKATGDDAAATVWQDVTYNLTVRK